MVEDTMETPAAAPLLSACLEDNGISFRFVKMDILEAISLLPKVQKDAGDVPASDPCQPELPGLPDLVVNRILKNLIVPAIDPSLTKAVGCSSTDDSNPLDACLTESEDTWWISSGARRANVEMDPEYVDFSLAPSPSSSNPSEPPPSMVRLTKVGIKIPPLPQGPMSVRTFALQKIATKNGDESNNSTEQQREDTWIAASPIFTLASNTRGWQNFELRSDIPDGRLRLVCLSTQTSEVLRYQYVGFFSVRFG